MSKSNKETGGYMNVIMSMLQNLGIQLKIIAQWPSTFNVLTWVSVWDAIIVLRDHGQVVHGEIISKPITQN